ncbi:Troponin C, partial [Durusdinium trenchii]
DDELDARLEEVIEMFQEPRTAVLNASHLGDALHIAGMNPKDSEVSKVLEDIGNPESLTLPEFKQVMKDELAKWTSKDQVQELPSCFRLFDPQDNGFVPRETVAEIMQHGGNHFSEEMLEDMLKNVPSTREGYDARQLVAFLLDPEAKKEERARRDDSDAEPAELDNQKEQRAARGRTEGEEAETSSLAQAQASDRGEEQVAGLPPPEVPKVEHSKA